MYEIMKDWHAYSRAASDFVLRYEIARCNYAETYAALIAVKVRFLFHLL